MSKVEMADPNAWHVYIITKARCADIIKLNKIITNKTSILGKKIIYHFDMSDPSYKLLTTITNFIKQDDNNIDSRAYKGESFKNFITTSRFETNKKYVLFVHKRGEKEDFLEYKNFAILHGVRFNFAEYTVKRVTNARLDKFNRNILNKIRNNEKLKRLEINYDVKNDRVISLKIKNKEFMISEFQYLLSNIMLYLRMDIK